MDLSFIQTPIVSALLAVTTVFSVVFAFYSHKTNHKFHSLCYIIVGYHVFDKSDLFGFADMHPSFDGAELKDVYYFTLMIQNYGTIAINPSDLTEGGSIPLKISDKNLGEIKPVVFSKVAEVDDYDAKFRIEAGNDETKNSVPLKILFDYIPPKSGVLLEFMSNVSPKEFYLSAKTKDHGPISKRSPELTKVFLFGLMYVVIFGAAALYSMGYATSILDKSTPGNEDFGVFALFAGTLIVAVGGSGLLCYLAFHGTLRLFARPTTRAFHAILLKSARKRSAIF